MKKRIVSFLLSLCMVCSLLPGTAWAVAADTVPNTSIVQQSNENQLFDEDQQLDAAPQPYAGNDNNAIVTVPNGRAVVMSNNTEYESLDAAMEAAADGDTIYLGAGTYCGNAAEPTAAGNGAGKSLTFVGAGTEKTTWQIKAPETPYGADGWCDYSFHGSDSIAFENMTVIGSVYPDSTTKHNDTQGLAYIDHITLKNCIFNGRADYWGYETTTFENVTFNAPGTAASGINDTDYSLWTYTGNSYKFKNCTFNSAGKTINVYRHGTKQFPSNVTINFESCTVKNSTHKKQAMKINDETMGDYQYIINISGDNKVEGIEPNKFTCSRLFGFDPDDNNPDASSENSGRTVVNIEGTTVWEDGARKVEHNHDFETGSYSNGKVEDTANKYTDGYKDNAFTTTYGSWEWNQTENKFTRNVTKTCNYCGYEETTHETKELELDVSRSKTATALDGNDHSTVTLSLPSAEEKLASDVVFVLDTSDCVSGVMTQISELVAQLKTAQEKNQADIKVGAVIFNGSAYTMFDGKLVDAATAIESLNKLSQLKEEKDVWTYLGLDNDTNYVKKGSNLHAGLRATQKLLESDNTVAAERKYLMSITDGMTYYWNDDADNVCGVYSENSYGMAQLLFYPWKDAFKIGNGYSLLGSSITDWDDYINDVRSRINSDGNKYVVNVREMMATLGCTASGVREVPLTSVTAYIARDSATQSAHGIEHSVMACLDTYQEMVNAGYQCYTLNSDYNMSTFPGLFTSKLNEMANKDVVDFNSIQNDILYAVGAGSVVEDKMGADFDFVPGSLVLTVGGTPLDSKTEGSATYFGAQDTTKEIASDNCRFKVEYDVSEDKFTWTINENVSNFAPVQLSYQVKLVNRSTTAGSYTVPTNEYAKLTPKDSNGKIGTALDFNVPTASYTIYVLNYDANGGSGAPDGEIKRTDKFTVSNTAPTRDGYNFVGWNTAADGSGTDYPAGSEITLTKESPALTLYARWTEVVPATPSPTPSTTPSATPAPTAAPTATPTSIPAPTATATAAKTAAIPQTSDAFPIEALLALLAIGAAGFGAEGYLRKKHH